MTELAIIIVGFIAGRLTQYYLSRARHDHNEEMAYLSGHVDGYGAALADLGAVEL